MFKNISALFFIVVFVFAGRAYSQNCIPVGGPNPLSYTQNFDGFGNSPSPQNTDAANIIIVSASGPRRVIGKFDNAVSDSNGTVNVPGWALFEQGTNVSSVSGRYAAGSGTDAGGNTYSFAPASAPADRALGSLNADDISTTMLGACFVNQNATALARVVISYTGEMYRRGAAGSGLDTLSFEYGLNASNIYSGLFTPYSALNFTTPNTAGAAGVRNGNDAAYRTVFPPNVIDLVIQPGDRFYVRWTDQNIVGNDDGLAIDDFSIQFLTVSAAPVSVSGRVIDGNGRAVSGAIVSLSMGDNSARSRSIRTNSFGFYRFTDLPSGGTAILSVQAKANGFRIPSRIVNLDGDLANVDFVAF
jgi:hypothetical protein